MAQGSLAWVSSDQILKLLESGNVEKSASVTWHSTSQNSWFASNSYLHISAYICICLLYHIYIYTYAYDCTHIHIPHHWHPKYGVKPINMSALCAHFSALFSSISCYIVASAIVLKEQHFLPLPISPFFARFQSKASCETSCSTSTSGPKDDRICWRNQHLWISSVTFFLRGWRILWLNCINLWIQKMTQWPPPKRNFFFKCVRIFTTFSRNQQKNIESLTFNKSDMNPSPILSGPLKSLWIWSPRSGPCHRGPWKTFHD